MVNIHRRTLLKNIGCQTLLAGCLPVSAFAAKTSVSNNPSYLTKRIPASGESLSVIGMGTWQTFNVGSDPKLRNARTRVLQTFFARGGQMVDSSPMYGSSQDVLGYALTKLNFPKELFSADKIWTRSGSDTDEDMHESLAKWKLNKFRLMQVHNLLSWEDHLPHLQAMKDAGKLRYVGVTTSHGRRHDDIEKILQTHNIDFLQLTYNMTHRDVEQRLLPLAQEKGVAVIANRPFDGGTLVDAVKRSNSPLPSWAYDIGCKNWPQFLLKFVVSHPAVTCAIPATSKVVHMKENMGALLGELPDAAMRNEMFNYLNKIL